MIIKFAITALISALTLAFGHYFNWRGLLGKPLGRIPSYVYGTAAIVAPLGALFMLEGMYEAAIALAVVTPAAGITVMACHGFDNWIESRNRAMEAEERERRMLERRMRTYLREQWLENGKGQVEQDG